MAVLKFSVKRQENRGLRIFSHILFILIAIICIYPLLLVVGVSFSSEQDVVQNGYQLIPEHISLKGYAYVFREGIAILRSYLNTIIATAVGTVLSTLVVALYAYPIARADFRYRKFFSIFVLFPMLFNGGVVPWYIVCTQLLHLKNSLLALFVPYIMNMWYVLIMRTFFKQSIPHSIIESAKIDGAGEFRIFFQIVMPLALPGLASIAFFACVAIWNDYRLPLYLITDMKKFNIQYLLWRIQSNIQFLSQISGNTISAAAQRGIPGNTARMALCVLSVGPIIFAFPFFQRYFVRGLTLGALKE